MFLGFGCVSVLVLLFRLCFYWQLLSCLVVVMCLWIFSCLVVLRESIQESNPCSFTRMSRCCHSGTPPRPFQFWWCCPKQCSPKAQASCGGLLFLAFLCSICFSFLVSFCCFLTLTFRWCTAGTVPHQKGQLAHFPPFTLCVVVLCLPLVWGLHALLVSG